MGPRTYKLLVLLLVFSVVVGPYVHALAGCDDDSAAASAKELASHSVDHDSSGTNKPTGLPDDACCSLALAVVTFAYSGHPALSPPGAESPIPATLRVVWVRPVLDLLACHRTGEPRHPPPGSSPTFLLIHTLLI